MSKTILHKQCGGSTSPKLVHRVVNACFNSDSVEIEKRIKGSIEVQVKAVVKDWGAAEDTKTFVGNLEAVLLENDGLLQDARIKLHNS